MIIALGGDNSNGEKDPFWLVPPNALDEQLFKAELTQVKIENLQILSFLTALSASFRINHPIELIHGNDPPDKFVRIDKREIGVELTEAAITDVRRDLAQARYLGRLLLNKLNENLTEYPHLDKKIVSLSVNQEQPAGQREKTVDDICELLKTDQGYVGENVDFSKGFPKVYPNSNGFYGSVDQISVQVHLKQQQQEPGIQVSSSTQTEIRLSQIDELLEERVNEKDKSCNEILIISCGLPDKKGYSCPLDTFMFGLIEEHLSNFCFSPSHLKLICLHNFQRNKVVELYRNKDFTDF
ncbi:hypothetical protein FLL45_04300 [Aliikangiella marina]|uniref:Uncharacterized protein n=1 Tax=Aliikangiella marina TaxID=1712262 RepID=A0A545TIX8_9GAMM|nr:hypothetical protein [Aliikangiella marina]TQV77175.1 hypothetical protein FLL45_04300 [Aliikangiella marina]